MLSLQIVLEIDEMYGPRDIADRGLSCHDGMYLWQPTKCELKKRRCGYEIGGQMTKDQR